MLIHFSAPTVIILGGKNSSKITFKTSAEYDAGCASMTRPQLPGIS